MRDAQGVLEAVVAGAREDLFFRFVGFVLGLVVGSESERVRRGAGPSLVFGRRQRRRQNNQQSKTHIVRQAQLLEVPQALELGRVDDRDAGRLQIKVACFWVGFGFAFRLVGRFPSSERRPAAAAANALSVSPSHRGWGR